ncbi:hypothetical protein [Mesorhizobium sp. M0239]|uniref:hypothetical protein n=1 Tax=Mesorhizobium sp. M0239 TaxID=2956924 RepID=UPI00333A277E
MKPRSVPTSFADSKSTRLSANDAAQAVAVLRARLYRWAKRPKPSRGGRNEAQGWRRRLKNRAAII